MQRLLAVALKRHGFAKQSVIRCRRGALTVEMAFGLPFLIVLLIGMVEFGRYNLIDHRTHLAAQSMVMILAQYEDQEFTEQDKAQLVNLWRVINPTATLGQPTNGEPQDLAVGLSSFSFAPDPSCAQPSCTEPDPEWVYADSNGVPGANLRTCAVAVIPDDETTGDELPEAVVGNNPVVSVDLAFLYQPLLSGVFIGDTVIRSRVFHSMRSETPLTLNSGAGGSGSNFQFC